MPGRDTELEGDGTYYAHSRTGLPCSTWEPLEVHLHRVADGDPDSNLTGAADFADAFGAGNWGRLAGLWHDLGKFAPKFQNYLRETANLAEDDPQRLQLRGSVDHATAGALHAVRQLGPAGRLLAYAITGHHAGLPNTNAEPGERSSLESRLECPPDEARAALDLAPRNMLESGRPLRLSLTLDQNDNRHSSFQLAFFTRMLFSALVDADYLATEHFFKPRQAESRTKTQPSMTDLAGELEGYLSGFDATDTTVNQWRAYVLDASLSAARRPPGAPWFG